MVAGVDAKLDESSVVDVAECEDKIVSQLQYSLSAETRGQLSAETRDQVQRVLSEANERLHDLGCDTRLVVIRRANSLLLYFICMTLAAVMGLRHQWCTGRLRVTIESLFTLLSGATRTVRVKRLTWPLTDYQRCFQFFTSVQGKQTI